ncbi:MULTISPECIES: indole-3-glycerol phosphate synthase TrpC [Priestia]|jgi:indole-3-glycerol phosphate synthase|uniref:indole-3-glycerol phosphate synthase TrpC n=1 Tax=Priestia TaxID=2800373 RepID=UPI0007C47910|nr:MULTISPECIES: indole-3-glycerol phosphate synthase TrpC [Priestia]MBZ5478177.1 indole-3-glycerol phosphate synthase TrpC [Bacillus sp. T_4]MDH6652662.1 indole-3-glycerol phosphate synthase [Bacillus sp. PvP124]MBG9475103.1 indole-3-glycerol phosphate synthase [Priestia megaterium]MCG0048705.1 indole-3-glycerol phosphate synthase TrpC [Priestia aryabhattai]MCI4623759.1 indole-3-glycerol phosphate synthase TrpC [Priestia megaterium]
MLNKIIETKKEEIQNLQLPEQQNVAKRSFLDALSNPNRELALIAEVKKASPSKGLIKENFQPVEIAKAYEKGKTDALSVLTDQHYFQGHRTFLSDIKQHVSVPVLRKDFIIDSIQVEESARIGADAILLIGEALEPLKLQELYLQAAEKELDCLVEVHSLETLEKLLAVFTPKIIGINNRNLHTFETSLQQTKEIAKHVPKDQLLVSESGIYLYDDVSYVKEAGAKAILVGESLMRQDNQTKAIEKLFGESEYAH